MSRWSAFRQPEGRILDINPINDSVLGVVEEIIMAMRLSGRGCRIATSYAKDGDREVTHLYCQSRLMGFKCPLERLPGTNAFELGPACFEPVRRKSSNKV